MTTNKIKFKDTDIEYTVQGKGKTIVLLHGYMESLSAWDDFKEELSNNFQIIAIDLPGHGNSGIVDKVHSMELMAECVDEVVFHLGIEKFSIVGHSMGGYVALEYLSKFHQKIESYCLFHSTPFEDTDEKKAERDRIIDLIKQGKKVQLAKNHVEKTFADINIDIFAEQIGYLKIIAVNTPDKGVIASLEGMKERKNHFKTMQHSSANGLWILGEQDNFIAYNNITKIELPQNCELFTLKNSGHQGYIEEQEKTVQKFNEFFSND